jgi:hypothetical protein
VKSQCVIDFISSLAESDSICDVGCGTGLYLIGTQTRFFDSLYLVFFIYFFF